MNRIEFMKELELLLNDIPVSEREEALQYYNDYFDDAGPLEEERIIQELGSPVKVAILIKETVQGGDDEAGEFTEHGYEDTRYEQPYNVPVTVEEPERRERKKLTTANKVIIAVICLLALPIIFGSLGSLLRFLVGGILGAAAIIFAIFVAAGAISAGFLISGAIVFVSGIVQAISYLGTGFFMCGIGLILLALGLFALVAAINIYKRLVPAILRLVITFLEKVFRRGGDTDEQIH